MPIINNEFREVELQIVILAIKILPLLTDNSFSSNNV